MPLNLLDQRVNRQASGSRRDRDGDGDFASAPSLGKNRSEKALEDGDGAVGPSGVNYFC